MNAIIPEFWLFFGRLHPVVVHLPIGFIVLLVSLEIAAWLPRFRHLRAARGAMLALTLPAIGLSAWCGWLLAGAGGYAPELLEQHLWSGLGVATVCLLAMMAHRLRWRVAYGLVLVLLFVGLVLAGHLGGSLTHGQDYLTRYLPAVSQPFGTGDPVPAPAPNKGKPDHPASASAFAVLVQPVLEANCVACHGPAKAKGDLRLDTLAAILKPGKNGAVVKPGNSAESKLYQWLCLPPQDSDHMPPAGKPQPSTEEIAVIQWWIDAGAPGDTPAADLKLPPKLQHLLKPSSPAPASAMPDRPNSPPSAPTSAG